jgi:hypothetical protein
MYRKILAHVWWMMNIYTTYYINLWKIDAKPNLFFDPGFLGHNLINRQLIFHGITLLEKRFIRISEIYFLYWLISVVDIINKK